MSKEVRRFGFSAYVIIAGAVQAAVFTIPFKGNSRPDFIYIFPPIGAAQQFIQPMSLLLVGVASIAPWFISATRLTKRIAFLGAAILVSCAISYALLMSTKLVTVPAFAQGKIFHFTIGNKKTSTAIDTFGPNCEKKAPGLSDDCDVAMLQALGPTDESVSELWTKSSVLQSHLEILVSYLGCLIGFNLFVGATAKHAQLVKRTVKALPRG